MGHANLDNMSRLFVRQLYAKGSLTIRQAVEVAVKRGETVHASEGELSDESMVAMGLEQVVHFLQQEGVIQCFDLTDQQQKILEQWQDGDITNWDCGDDGRSGEYGMLDSIQWRYAPGWRKRYPNIPLLGNVTN